MTHPRLTEISDDEVRKEIQDGARAVAEVVGERPHLFRAPGFHADERVLAIVAELKLDAVFADVDPQDWRPGLIVPRHLQPLLRRMLRGRDHRPA